MLKLILSIATWRLTNQPPLGGCVLKPAHTHPGDSGGTQPPLGGCVLKQQYVGNGAKPV